VLLPEPFLERPVHVTPTDIDYIWVCREKDYGYAATQGINTPLAQHGPELMLDSSLFDNKLCLPDAHGLAESVEVWGGDTDMLGQGSRVNHRRRVAAQFEHQAVTARLGGAHHAVLHGPVKRGGMIYTQTDTDTHT
jgi:hypothetical protein